MGDIALFLETLKMEKWSTCPVERLIGIFLALFSSLTTGVNGGWHQW